MTYVAFNYYAPEEPFGILSVVPSYLGLRIYFTDSMTDDSALRDPDNYTITAVGLVPADQIHHSDVISVTPEDVVNPTYVDLECTDLTHGEAYRITITPGELQNDNNEYLNAGANEEDYIGVSVLPAVQSVRPISDTIMEVIFTKEMSPTEGLVDPASYWFDEGLVVREVIVVAPGIIHLVTTRQVASKLYTLTLT